MATILVIDDIPSSRQRLVNLLAQAGHEVMPASGGEEGLALARSQVPDLIVADLLLPGIDGYRLAHRIRNDRHLTHTPMLFCTQTYLVHEAHALAVSCGNAGAIDKAAEEEEIQAEVARLLSRRTAAEVADNTEPDQVRELTRTVSTPADKLRFANARFRSLVDLASRCGTEHDADLLMLTYCERARALVAARYAVIALPSPESCETVDYLLCQADGQTVRAETTGGFGAALMDLLGDQRSARFGPLPGSPEALGMPAAHPPVNFLLGAPVRTASRMYGWLYVVDRIDGESFDDDDERIILSLAAMLGTLFDNSRLIRELEVQAELLRLDREREEFFAAMTHDLKAPLTGADRTLSYLLDKLDRESRPEEARLLAILKESNDGLLRMVASLMDAYRYETGLKSLNYQDLDLESLVNSCMDEFRPLAAGKRLALEFTQAPEKIVVCADLLAMRRLMTNLLSNAIKFTEEQGRIVVSASQQQDAVVVEVWNSGPGIPQEDRQDLFQRFWRPKRSRRCSFGTGLGLYLCKQIAESHGGTISYDPDSDGTKFSVTLPRRPAYLRATLK
ncbi:MAG TPA: ATP-binding protein [Candidatus Obscuribacterales bacterium]